MSILAISETAGSLGKEIGHTVAASLGHEFADREIISKAAERFGEGVLELTHATEERPTLWERFTETRHRYMAYIEAIVLEMAARDNVVLVGRASTVILARIHQALRVRISAPESTRAQRVHQAQGLTPEAALDYVRRSDRERAARVKFLYHLDWDDPLFYDLVVNTERLSVDEGARLLRHALKEERLETTTTARKAMRDLSLAAQAKAALLANPMTRSRQIFVTATDGHIALSGSVRTEEERRVAAGVVASIPGVTGVLNDIVAPPPNLGKYGGA
jgi:cytidylate kinase